VQVGFTRLAAHYVRNSGRPELRYNPSLFAEFGEEGWTRGS
jgi:hypothetical protein